MRNEKGQFVKGHTPWHAGTEGIIKNGFKVGHKGYKNSGNFQKNNIPWSKGKKGVMKAWNKGKENLNMKSEKNINWKGGISPIMKLIRHSIRYKEWREKVFKRDNYTCQWCFQRGKKLNADHIKEFSKYPKVRFDLNNGRTLCKECHQSRYLFEQQLLCQI